MPAALQCLSFLCVVLLVNHVSGEKKVSVSEVSFDSSVEDIQWTNNDHRTVLVKTTKGRLYRSVDAGRTWTEITESLGGDGDASRQIVVDSLIVHPMDPKAVLVVGTKHTHFVSENGAKTFRRLTQKMTIHNWQFHPLKPKWALLSTWSEGCTPGVEGDCNHILYVTKDFGRTFDVVSSYVVQFSWGDKTKPDDVDSIYFTHHRVKKGNQQRYGGWSKTVDFARTSDGGENVSILVERGNKFLVSNGFIFVARLEDAEKQTVKLSVSSDGGATFRTGKLSAELQEKSYTVLDTSEGAIMLHVNHGDVAGGSNTGSVYVSDATGSRYTLSLPGNFRTVTGECEFDKVQSLEGVYIANYKANTKATESNVTRTNAEKTEEANDSAGETQVDKRKGKHAKGKSDDMIKTVISFDKGGVWSYLRPPKVDSKGNPINCPHPDDCWLHLHGITNFHHYAPFYSVENAPGVIMGTGNVGTHLRYDEDDVNTYLSRDGGLTWLEAHKGAYIYEFGDHGGVLVMADDIRKTSQVVFSWNEGQSWYDFELGRYPLEVDNIVIEPNSSSVEFLLYGTRDDAGVLYHLDFGALGQPPCKGVWAADSVSSDYETWTPTDGRKGNERCVLGRQVTYTRRKQTSECFNGRDFERPTSRKNCACTKEDFECELGFTRKVGSLECIPEEGALTSPECVTSSYFKAMGYRKVPGDTCVDGWFPEEQPVICPAHSPFSRGAKTVLSIIVVLALLLVFVTCLSKSEQFRHFFHNYGFDNFQSVKYSMLGVGADNPFDLDSSGHHHKFEPEMGFIDSELDEHEEDAPTLMSYTNTSQTEDLESEQRDQSQAISRRLAPAATDAVPRLLPPPGSATKEMELL
eukprot:GHVN01000620.1.p1 GENE.GHVN01000620.1~~GHVN01000620.1.p1  ORF type:complete len:860 (+),score=84.35 GHVN01000620.1:105-2684(+)